MPESPQDLLDLIERAERSRAEGLKIFQEQQLDAMDRRIGHAAQLKLLTEAAYGSPLAKELAGSMAEIPLE